jgi:hypothetical protein
MTSEEKVKEKYPKAYAEKYQSKMWGGGEVYYLIWSSRLREEKIRLGEGKTESSAWVNAKNELSA